MEQLPVKEAGKQCPTTRQGHSQYLMNNRPEATTPPSHSFFVQIVFKDGRVYAQNRFVSTAAWDPNAPAGEGSAGAVRAWTPRPGGWSKNAFRLPANPCNTSVMMKGGRLYALSEGGKPTEMDPVTLDTIEESDLGGISVRPGLNVVMRAVLNLPLRSTDSLAWIGVEWRGLRVRSDRSVDFAAKVSMLLSD